MPKLFAFSGSLRKGSFNSMLLRAAVELVPPGTTLEVGSIHGIPLYDGDLETSAFPQAAQALKDGIAGADGLLLVSPEYNNSIPGVMKNAIDWASRPPADMARVFSAKPVAVIGATPGGGGTMLAQAAWLPVLRTLGTLPWFGGRFMVSGASKVFDADGALKDAALRDQLQKFLAGFSAFVAAQRR